MNTNLEHAKQHVDSIRLEIEKGMEGGFCCDHYIKEKIYQLMKIKRIHLRLGMILMNGKRMQNVC